MQESPVSEMRRDDAGHLAPVCWCSLTGNTEPVSETGFCYLLCKRIRLWCSCAASLRAECGGAPPARCAARAQALPCVV
eukprot:1158958-Pelagomonas_calceolata.AAC.7